MNVKRTVKKIESYRDRMMCLSDEELKAKTQDFRNRIAMGISLDTLLPEAFATVREAGRRVLGMEAYPVQLMSGIEIYLGNISEQKTGEGKSLVAAAPSYLMALTGNGVHVVTVNDYLAKRDASEIGQIHNFLGLTVGCVLSGMETAERKSAYGCDITYVTNTELGFDYLRDNMAMSADKVVQRGLHYAIIDEVDSILIDEARTPLIISGSAGKSMELYTICDYLARYMMRGETSGELTKMDIINGKEIVETGDFIVNEKDRLVYLTEAGTNKVERAFALKNFADDDNVEIQHHMILALKAHHLMHRDVDYVVKDDEVMIVDEFTGRIMPGRRYSDGLHQAIEAKEHVTIQKESRTLATITYQNFFNKYEKKAGMTGTAKTEEKEFRTIYGMKVIQIPTNKPVIRVDDDDNVYLTKAAKYAAIVDAVKIYHAKGQPVLVGTVSIEVSELLSEMLKKEGVKHEVLNAKQHEREAEIVALAGRHGAVTIATNMAGRGTDIKLDDEAKAAGGLVIIGTERHESRRIDNQLRGRAGRQGDPGLSRFYISLEDDLLRLFGGDRTATMFKNIGVQETDVLKHRSLSKVVESAQKKIEGNNYGTRKNLLDFDEVNNQQRDAVYELRRKILHHKNLRDDIERIINDTAEDLVYQYCSSAKIKDWDFEGLRTELCDLIPAHMEFHINTDCRRRKDLIASVQETMMSVYKMKQTEFSTEQWTEVERIAMLRSIDAKWMQELDDLEQTKQGINLMSYGQKDPVVEYKMQAYTLYEHMVLEIHKSMLRMLFHAHIVERTAEITKKVVNEDGTTDASVEIVKSNIDVTEE